MKKSILLLVFCCDMMAAEPGAAAVAELKPDFSSPAWSTKNDDPIVCANAALARLLKAWHSGDQQARTAIFKCVNGTAFIYNALIREDYDQKESSEDAFSALQIAVNGDDLEMAQFFLNGTTNKRFRASACRIAPQILAWAQSQKQAGKQTPNTTAILNLLQSCASSN